MTEIKVTAENDYACMYCEKKIPTNAKNEVLSWGSVEIEGMFCSEIHAKTAEYEAWFHKTYQIPTISEYFAQID